MHVLLTNDDGILAPGLAAMHRVASAAARTTVVAPEGPRSAIAHAITVGDDAITVSRIHAHGQFHGYAVDGQPADCVKLALRELLDGRPDMVVSGVNDGANLGINVLYSGTIAAAAEGAFFGLPSFAVSLERGDNMDFDRAAALAWQVIERVRRLALSGGYLVNINVPRPRPGAPKGVRVVPQSTLNMNDSYRKSVETPERIRYHLEGVYGDLSGEIDTDLHAVGEGYIAVTPLQFDLTDRAELRVLESAEWPSLD
jgi:5'-nucleotidase